MKSIFWLLIIFLNLQSISAQKIDQKLHKKINEIIEGFNGEIGIYIKNLKTNKTVMINADSVFPTASIVKVPILIGVMDKINKGELTYHQEMQYKDSLLYAGVDILGSFKQNEKIELSKLMMLMLTMSDNTASLWLQSLAGTGTRINYILDSLGFRHTRVNSRTPGREGDRTNYGWGQTTAREMAAIFEKIYKGEMISQSASDKMLRLLNKNYFDHVAVTAIPPYATVFTKNGAVNKVRNEVVLVKGNKSNYVLSIFTKNNKDESWKNNNEAWELTRSISKLLWNYFEPKDQWKRSADADKWD